jgi:heptosyltransferase-2
MEKPRKIAVLNTAFLGDAVLTLPLIEALRRRFPGTELHYVVRGGLERLFAHQPGITSCTGLYKRGKEKSLAAAWSFGRALAGGGIDLLVSAHTSLRTAVLALGTGARIRIGYDQPWFNRRVYTTAVPRRFEELEEIERLLLLAAPLGIEGPAPEVRPALLPARLAEAEAFRQEFAGGRPLLGIHPGSTWATKKWPSEYFAELARRATDAGARVAVFGGPGEEADARAVIESAGLAGDPRAADLSGRLGLNALAAHLSLLDCYVTNDSGPMHLSWMLGTPTVALFGPTVRRLGFFPRGKHATVLEVPTLGCRPCGLHGPTRCPEGGHDCMRKLTPDLAWPPVARALGLHA